MTNSDEVKLVKYNYISFKGQKNRKSLPTLAKSSDDRWRIWLKATSPSLSLNCIYVAYCRRDRLWIDNRILFSYRVGKDVIQYLKGLTAS